jgi:hypothetical protein
MQATAGWHPVKRPSSPSRSPRSYPPPRSSRRWPGRPRAPWACVWPTLTGLGKCKTTSRPSPSRSVTYAAILIRVSSHLIHFSPFSLPLCGSPGSRPAPTCRRPWAASRASPPTSPVAPTPCCASQVTYQHNPPSSLHTCITHTSSALPPAQCGAFYTHVRQVLLRHAGGGTRMHSHRPRALAVLLLVVQRVLVGVLCAFVCLRCNCKPVTYPNTARRVSGAEAGVAGPTPTWP